jgi:carboxylate-amine ligase
VRTFGVEEELLLVSVRSGVPVAVAPAALVDAPTGGDVPPLSAEIQQEMLETQTWPRDNLTDLMTDIVAGRTLADALAQKHGARAAALAMSPLRVRPHVTDNPRYAAMLARFGSTARNTMVCGCHVHVSIESREEGVAVLDRIRTWLPLLLALSANSPFSAGADTGYASFRFASWHQWQSAGPTDVFGSVEAYDRFERMLVGTEVILDYGMLYLDARLSHKQPTLEVRVADVCLDARDTAVVAALVRALVDTAAADWRAGVPPVEMPSAGLRLASWQAALTGVNGRLPHPVHGSGVPAADAIEALTAHVDAALGRNGDREEVQAGVDRILTLGGGADRQREAFARRGRMRDVVFAAVEATHTFPSQDDGRVVA